MKKGKLILSLSLISLAIAILCFGVLSAVTVNYNISGNITYSIQDVFVKINTRVYKIAEQQDKATVIVNVKELETTPLTSISTSKYTLSQTMVEYDSTNADTETVTHTAKDSSGNAIQIAYGDYYTYYIVINIQNLTSARSDVCAYLTDNTTGDTNSVKTTNLYQNNIASTETKNIVIAYSIKDKTSEVSNVAIDYSLKVSYETTGYTNQVEINNDTTNKEYYITLGTYNKSAVKWKLISLDGLNEYEYTDGSDALEGRYLSGAIFFTGNILYGYGYKVDESVSGLTYEKSTLRKTLSNPTTWGLTEFPSYLKAYVDTTEELAQVNGDKVWALSVDEAMRCLPTRYLAVAPTHLRSLKLEDGSYKSYAIYLGAELEKSIIQQSGLGSWPAAGAFELV